MKAKNVKEGYQQLTKLAESQQVLYTEKEIKMHVFGPKELCDADFFYQFRIKEHEDSPLLLDEAIAFYQQGFCLVADCIPKDRLRAAREYIDCHYHSWLQMSKRQDDWRMHFLLNLQHLTEEPIEHAPILNMILNSSKVLGRLEQLIGSKPNGCFYNQIAYRTPLLNYSPSILEYTPGAEYHIDGQANEYGTRFPDPWTVLVCVALVDIESLDMGNFTMFPGAHVSRNWSNYPEEKRLKALPSLGEPYKVRLKAGDVVLAHVLLPHRGGKNVTTAEDAERAGIEYDGLINITKGTREMALFRFRGSHIDYNNNPLRSESVLRDPWCEHQSLLQILEENNFNLSFK